MTDPLAVEAGPAPAKHQSIRLGVVFERRRIAHPWQEWRWKPFAVVLGAAPVAAPRLLKQGEDWAWYQLAALELELHPGETAAYRLGLAQKQPLVYVLWRPEGAGTDNFPDPFLVTVNPGETQDYLDGNDVKAEGVAMPEELASLLRDYVRAWHVEIPFKKRKRTPMAATRDAEIEDEDGDGDV
jgi:Protein of unknown function (DUF3305)